MNSTPADVVRDKAAHVKWSKKLEAMSLAQLHEEYKLVTAKGSTYYELYVRHVDEEICFRARVWISKDGRKQPIRDMEQQHLGNAIAKIEREQWRARWLSILKAEARRRKAAPAIARRLLRALDEETMEGLFEPRD